MIKKISLQIQVQVKKQKRRDGPFRISVGFVKPWPLVHRIKEHQSMRTEIRENVLAETSIKKKSMKKSVSAVMSSPSEDLERKAELKSQAPRSHLIMVLVFGSYCLGRIHNAGWLKPRALFPYLNHIPKNSACVHDQNCRTWLRKSHLP